MVVNLITAEFSHIPDIENCPVFVPAKLADNMVSELCINTKISKFDANNQFDFFGVFNLYFQKFFAGNMSLLDGFSDLPIENLYLCSVAKISKDVHVKQVINDTKKFDKVVGLIKSDNLINKNNLAKYNKSWNQQRSATNF